VQILDADPKTDWSKVDLEALRQHLIDMDEVTLSAAAAAKRDRGSLKIAVTGLGRTLVAIQRMIPAWGADNERPSEVEQESCLLAEWGSSHRHRDRSEGIPACSPSRLLLACW
jgi:hypothetical protein